MKVIVLPKLLTHPVYVGELSTPLDAIADVLDAQDQPELAIALRNAGTICKAFALVNLSKTAVLAQDATLAPGTISNN